MNDLERLSKKALIGEVLELRGKLRDWEALRAALNWVRVCSHCRSCWEEDEKRWVQFERYFHRRVASAQFTHGICKSCYELERVKNPRLPSFDDVERRFAAQPSAGDQQPA